MIGTAEPVTHWIAVELRSNWGRNALRDGGLPAPVRERLLGLVERRPRTRVVFIRRDRTEATGVQLYLARSDAAAPALWSPRVAAIDDVASFPFEQFLDEEEPPRNAMPPVALVCTHGQHDSCCGLRGYPAYEALRCRYEHVWQCSHIGGDRFAANVVVLPQGIYYGRVDVADAADLEASLREDRVVLRCYRGRSSHDRATQVIETLVRRARDLTHVDDVRVLDVRLSRPSVYLGRASDRSGAIHTVEVMERRTSDVAFLTCAAQRQQPRRLYVVLRHEIT